jgi:hypothetical protein
MAWERCGMNRLKASAALSGSPTDIQGFLFNGMIGCGSFDSLASCMTRWLPNSKWFVSLCLLSPKESGWGMHSATRFGKWGAYSPT